jgi:hypothetical protein
MAAVQQQVRLAAHYRIFDNRVGELPRRGIHIFSYCNILFSRPCFHFISYVLYPACCSFHCFCTFCFCIFFIASYYYCIHFYCAHIVIVFTVIFNSSHCRYCMQYFKSGNYQIVMNHTTSMHASEAGREGGPGRGRRMRQVKGCGKS